MYILIVFRGENYLLYRTFSDGTFSAMGCLVKECLVMDCLVKGCLVMGYLVMGRLVM